MRRGAGARRSFVVTIVSSPRQRALDATTGISRRILAAMPNLVAVRRRDGGAGDAVLYQDDELRGAVCATAGEAQILHHLARLLWAESVLEIGSYVGWTTAHLAESGAHVVCVEPFLETGGQSLNAEPSIDACERFLANMRRGRYCVTLVMGRSPEALATIRVPGGFDLAFIDGWHMDGQPRRDVQAVHSVLNQGGTIVLHDLHVPDVQSAARWLLDHGYDGLILTTPNWLGVFSRNHVSLDWVRGSQDVARLCGLAPGAHEAAVVFAAAADLLALVRAA